MGTLTNMYAYPLVYGKTIFFFTNKIKISFFLKKIFFVVMPNIVLILMRFN